MEFRFSTLNPNDKSIQFPQFDSVTDASDHHYVNSNKAHTTSTDSVFHKTIMKEWKILQKNLPPSIYVRIYEDRIDLLRAIIVGAAGTPYHDGLFCFDFAFPANYPNKPPLVHYKSFGHCINPNLYSSGFVCLSILNTWSGPSWQPNGSSVLQVLVSIQGLVLNSKPFFNEPVYHGKNAPKLFVNMSKRYTNDVFVLSCKTMVHMLYKPPKNFEGLVVEHFRDRGRSILTACKAYMNGYVRVGDYQDDGLLLPKKVKVSQSFKFSMTVQYPNLFNWFARNDPSLHDFAVQLNQLVEQTERKYEENGNSVNKKFTCRISGIVKKFFGLSKCIKRNAD